MVTHPVRFPPGSIVPAGLYRSTGSGRTRYFDGCSPLPGSVNSSSWQQVSDHYRVVRTTPAPHETTPETTIHPVRFAAGSVPSPGEYRNGSTGAVRYFDGMTPLPGGVNSASWQQVSDHYHAHRARVEADHRPLVTFPTASSDRGATATLEAPPATAVPAPTAPANAGELAIELVRLVNSGDVARIAELFSAEAVLVFPVGAMLVHHRGHVQLQRFLGWMRANLDSHLLSIERVSGAESSVTVDFDSRGRSAGGEDFDRPGAMVIEAARGRIRLVQVALGAGRTA